MKTIIAGGGDIGSRVAHVLAATGHDVTLVEVDDDRAQELAATMPARLVMGDACEPTVLEKAGVLTADLLVAATGDDEDNLVVALLAKRQFAVPRVVARVNDPDNAWLFGEAWGVDVPVSASSPLVSLVEEATGATDTVALLRLSRAGVNVIETTITAASRSAGRSLGEIPLAAGTVVAAVIRTGQPIVPDPAFVIEPGDEVLLVSDRAGGPDVHAAFQ
jgi:trk system potassium uptake protein TrkA